MNLNNKLENNIRIKKLFYNLFGNINFNKIDLTSPNYYDYKKIKDLFLYSHNRPDEMLFEIDKYLNTKFTSEQKKEYYQKNGIIVDLFNPNYTIYNNNNNLSRALEQASFYSNPVSNENNYTDLLNNNLIYTNSNQNNLIDNNPPNNYLTNNLPINFINHSSSNSDNLINYNSSNNEYIEPSPIIDNQDFENYAIFNHVLNTQDNKTDGLQLINMDLTTKISNLQNEVNIIKSQSNKDCQDQIDKVKIDLNNKIDELKSNTKD